MDTPKKSYSGKGLRELIISEIHKICMTYNPNLYGIPPGTPKEEIRQVLHNILYEELRMAYRSDSNLSFQEWYEEQYDDLPALLTFTEKKAFKEKVESLPEWLTPPSHIL